MEILVFIGAVCVLGILSLRFGRDSRQPPATKEQIWAQMGVNLDRHPSTPVATTPLAPQTAVASTSATSTALASTATATVTGAVAQSLS
jgi:hypothetical protein